MLPLFGCFIFSADNYQVVASLSTKPTDLQVGETVIYQTGVSSYSFAEVKSVGDIVTLFIQTKEGPVEFTRPISMVKKVILPIHIAAYFLIYVIAAASVFGYVFWPLIEEERAYKAISKRFSRQLTK